MDDQQQQDDDDDKSQISMLDFTQQVQKQFNYDALYHDMPIQALPQQIERPQIMNVKARNQVKMSHCFTPKTPGRLLDAGSKEFLQKLKGEDLDMGNEQLQQEAY